MMHCSYWIQIKANLRASLVLIFHTKVLRQNGDMGFTFFLSMAISLWGLHLYLHLSNNIDVIMLTINMISMQ
jgi:hypothetical protein